MFGGAMPGNATELREISVASLGCVTDISIFRCESFSNDMSLWHCLQVFRQSRFSASAVRSVTHCDGVRMRTSGGKALPVKSRYGSRTMRPSLGWVVM